MGRSQGVRQRTLTPSFRWFKSSRPSHKRNVFCLPRQKALFLALWGKIQAKLHKIKHIGFREGYRGCPGTRFFVSNTENRPKWLVYFLRFFALQRSRQPTVRRDLNKDAVLFCQFLLCKDLSITRKCRDSKLRNLQIHRIYYVSTMHTP